ncbi:alpha,alpha-trehalase TreF [Paraburkholderia silvatlantica]|uniref:Alpha,alpha-trehalase n=1 Tax=Paraburkholderia silvatlantica TaxID=321895 RepID=A0A2U1ABI4_9BURK|nr:alpha,alpha-trehalase TreF [Paraburkholderia silvatlantica]MBB2930241.1 alpha,alpha-trehalase [Paraburkholderia silvatlantica]PVY32070.1 alpha,alpha-trehalase [Paraburkholderia silvatlantica]PXW37690.1 alpha,alpha-trehalase [Paraburkholderia silvatlantica]PYE25511.1 alpha,alpha-trehalase [Paraburkholderia silvatlantica]TDQ97846.1 alpha,alpha-trehalase [Paraburkholderia silvatlantica]
MAFPFRSRTPASAAASRPVPFAATFAATLAAALCLAWPLAQSAQAADAAASASAPANAQELQTPAQSAKPLRSQAQHEAAKESQPATPADLYGRLYHDVQLAQIFPDSKTFADMLPNERPSRITAAYERWRQQHAGDHDNAARKAALAQFVNQDFTAPAQTQDHYVSDPNQDVVGHIDTLWNVLSRRPDAKPNPYSSLLPLPYAYVVPGGRFNEIYYWDSYFIMLGLEASGRHELALDELNNFAALIDRYGHIANGNRTYYLSRSQPPFFAQMVSLVAEKDGDAVYVHYLPQLRKEYDYWMAGAQTLEPGHAARHLVRLPDGTLLNRYWDARNRPRDESYREDILTARATPQRDASDLWRNLRAGAETGWDYSSRWLADAHTLSSIDVTSLAPVDLNSLMAILERTLAKAYGLKGDAREAERMTKRAQQRADAIDRVLWDPQLHAYSDYDFAHRTLTHRLTAATVYPLYAGVATKAEAQEVAAAVRAGLLRPGGLATTQVATGQQWDEPNGWAPLQYLAVMGLRRYGEQDLAQEIATRWIATNLACYTRTHKLVEKYDVSASATKASAAGGGEYPLQDGFGWTNGVLRVLLQMYPQTGAVQSAPAASGAAAASAP